MKKLIYSLSVAALLMTASCDGDDYREMGLVDTSATVEAPANATCESFIGAVYLGWDMPETEHFYYANVRYSDEEGNPVEKRISRFSVDETNKNRVKGMIEGLTPGHEYEFAISCVTYGGYESSSVTVKGTPASKAEACNYVLGTVDVEPIAEGAKFSWDNKVKVPVTLEVSYTDAANKAQTVSFNTLSTKYGEIKNLPVEDVSTLTYCCKNVEDEGVTDKVTTEVIAGPGPLDIYNPNWVYLLDNVAQANWRRMTIEYLNPEMSHMKLVTTGDDPYIYYDFTNDVPSSAKKIVFRYKANKKFNLQIFLNGKAPSADKMVAQNGIKKATVWTTCEIDMSTACQLYDFKGPESTKRFRMDFGDVAGHEIEIRNMHWE